MRDLPLEREVGMDAVRISLGLMTHALFPQVAMAADGAPVSTLHTLYDGLVALTLVAIVILVWRNWTHRRALERRDRQLKRLLKLSWELEEARDYGSILTAVSEAIKDEIGFANSWLFLAGPDDPDLVYLIADKASESVDIKGKHPTLRFEGDKMMEEIRDGRHPVVVLDAWTDPRTDKEQVAKNNNRTIVNVPLITSDRRLGCLGTGTFGDEGIRRLTPEEISFIEEAAKRLCPTLDRIEQYANRLQAEAESRRLAAAIDQTMEGVALADPDGTVRYSNPSFSLLLDIGRDQLIGAPLPLVEPHGVVAESVATGRRWRGRVTHRRDNGEVVELDLSLTPATDQEGGVTAIVAVVVDASDASRLERAKSFFASVTSHELRTPLTKLTMVRPYIESALSGQAEKPVVKSALDEVINGITQVVSATGILSALERGERNIGPVQRYELFAALEKHVAMAQQSSAEAGRAVTIDFRWKPRSPQVEMVGADLLTAAVDELLSNAVKYSPDGTTPTMTVVEKEEGIVIEVADQGAGMTAEEMGEAMTPFFSLERPELHSSGRYRYRGGGIGLGLTIAKMVAEYLGGDLTLSRRAGGGLSVTMTLPTVQVVDAISVTHNRE